MSFTGDQFSKLRDVVSLKTHDNRFRNFRYCCGVFPFVLYYSLSIQSPAVVLEHSHSGLRNAGYILGNIPPEYASSLQPREFLPLEGCSCDFRQPGRAACYLLGALHAHTELESRGQGKFLGRNEPPGGWACCPVGGSRIHSECQICSQMCIRLQI
jgi:hypothetical protein